MPPPSGIKAWRSGSMAGAAVWQPMRAPQRASRPSARVGPVRAWRVGSSLISPPRKSWVSIDAIAEANHGDLHRHRQPIRRAGSRRPLCRSASSSVGLSSFDSAPTCSNLHANTISKSAPAMPATSSLCVYPRVLHGAVARLRKAGFDAADGGLFGAPDVIRLSVSSAAAAALEALS